MIGMDESEGGWGGEERGAREKEEREHCWSLFFGVD